MRQSKRLVENGELNKRRMHKIDEFKDYFNGFIRDLERGELNLRLPKKKTSLRSDIKEREKTSTTAFSHKHDEEID
jgi:hypothetical protein